MLSKLFVTGILAAGCLLAQRGGGGMGGDEGGGGGGGLDIPMAPRVVNRIDSIASELKLDKDQKKSFKTTMDAAQKEAKPVHEQLVQSRIALGDAIQAGKSQDEIAGLVKSQAALETQLVQIELATFAKVYNGLQPEQRSGTRNLFQMMKGIFDTKNWNIVE